MKINYGKTKFILFNNCKNWNFQPEYDNGGELIELVSEMKILGVVIRSDMKWSSNTKYIVDKHRLKLAALHIILGSHYSSYSFALQATNLDTLAKRRETLCLKFGKKAAENEKHKNGLN